MDIECDSRSGPPVYMTNTKLYILSIFFGLLQLLDGILTYAGVTRFGISAEGNPLVKYFIDVLGPFGGIILVKCIGLVMLYMMSSRCIRYEDKNWLKKFLISMISFYLIFAIIPWLYVLSRA